MSVCLFEEKVFSAHTNNNFLGRNGDTSAATKVADLVVGSIVQVSGHQYQYYFVENV